MRALHSLENGYYHVYNRGTQKQILFCDDADYLRFLFLILHLQAPVSIPQVHRYIKNYQKTNDFLVSDQLLAEIESKRIVNILNFCIMPNHFHMTLEALSDGALSIYMQKVGNAYSKYFNKRYNKSGHVFQGAYQMRQIFDENDLVYLSAYIHKNPVELHDWKDVSDKYPWSSYQDMKSSRWGKLVNPETIFAKFKHFSDYKDFVTTSGAKEMFGEEVFKGE